MTSIKTLASLVVALVLLSGCLGGKEKPGNETLTTVRGNVTAGDTSTYPTAEGMTTTLFLSGVQPETSTLTVGQGGLLGKTFKVDNVSRICKRGPYIEVRMYSNSTCEECLWMKDIYDKVVREWEGYGRVYPIRWEVDVKDNALTGVVEGEIPPVDMQLWRKYSPERVLPTFILGCRYYREGTPYYAIGDRRGEEQELRKTIKELVDYSELKEREDAHFAIPELIDPSTTSTLFTSSTSTTSTSSTSTSTTSTSTTSSTTTTFSRHTTSLPGLWVPGTPILPGPFPSTPKP